MALKHQLHSKAASGQAAHVKPASRRVCAAAFKPAGAAHGPEPSRRDVLGIAALMPVLANEALKLAFPRIAAAEEEAAVASASAAASIAYRTLSDNQLAYSFSYPVSTKSGRPVKLLTTHEPEKYSSAPPLNADARQRIVAELFAVSDAVTITVSVGPASGVLKGVPVDSWKGYDVAETVLIDRSTARLTTGQRTSLNDVEGVTKDTRDGLAYWVYEHVSQGSPTVVQPTKETYRHSYAVTTYRPAQDGTPFLYTLNLSCPQALWDEMEPGFKGAVESFRLTTPGRDFIDPEQNPWLFF